MKLVKKLDWISPEIKMTINKKETFKSTIGGFLTIVWVIMSILGFYAFAWDIIGRNHPQLVYNKKLNPQRSFDLNTENFTLMFAILDEDFVAIENLERKASLSFNVQSFTVPWNISDLNNQSNYLNKDNYNNELKNNSIATNNYLIRCNTIDLTSFFKSSSFKQHLLTNLSNYWCLPSNTSFTLKNGVYEPDSIWLKIKLSFCTNTTKTRSDSDCFAANEISKTFSKKTNIHYIISENTLDAYDYKQPVKEVFFSTLVAASPYGSYKTKNFYWLKKLFYGTDDSFIFKSNNEKEYFQKDYVETFFSPIGEDLAFYEFVFSLAREADFYNRSYLKIQSVIAYLGGFISFFKLVFEALTKVLIERDVILLFEALFFRRPLALMKNKGFDCKSINLVGNVNGNGSESGFAAKKKFGRFGKVDFRSDLYKNCFDFEYDNREKNRRVKEFIDDIDNKNNNINNEENLKNFNPQAGLNLNVNYDECKSINDKNNKKLDYEIKFTNVENNNENENKNNSNNVYDSCNNFNNFNLNYTKISKAVSVSSPKGMENVALYTKSANNIISLNNNEQEEKDKNVISNTENFNFKVYKKKISLPIYDSNQDDISITRKNQNYINNNNNKTNSNFTKNFKSIANLKDFNYKDYFYIDNYSNSIKNNNDDEYNENRNKNNLNQKPIKTNLLEKQEIQINKLYPDYSVKAHKDSNTKLETNKENQNNNKHNINDNNIKNTNHNLNILQTANCNEILQSESLSAEKKTANLDSKLLSLHKFLFPCFLKKGSLDRKKFDYLKKIKMLKNKFFSFEKVIKTIRNLKLTKNLIFNDQQKYFFKYCDLYDLNHKKLFFKKSLKFDEYENHLSENLKIFKHKTYKKIKTEAKNNVNFIEGLENANQNLDFRINHKLIQSLNYLDLP